MRLARRISVAGLGVVALVLVVVAAAWVLDGRSHKDRVMRNTTLAGTPVGGMRRAELGPVVADVARRYAASPVVVQASGGGFTTDTRELGVVVDPAATVEATYNVGRTGSAPARAWSWLRSFTTDRRAPVQVKVDNVAVRRVVAARDPHRVAPVEPAVTARPDGSGFTVVPGKPGKGIDPVAVVSALPTAAAVDGPASPTPAARAADPISVKVGRGDVPPNFSVADAEGLARQAEATVSAPFSVRAGTATATVAPTMLRGWVRSEATAEGLHLALDGKRAVTDLAKLLPGGGTAPVETTFVVTGGQPQARLGHNGTACCDASAGPVVERALLSPARTLAATAPAPAPAPLDLPLKVVPPRIGPAELGKLGIREQVSTFTTRYMPGQPRVTNIHRFADIVKGHVIMPGDTFSLNGFVGERTLAKGFVVDHQINDEGKFDEAVGGGVSQFATTIFNAAFFAGLEYGEYQSHSIYISRYPYGREATVSWMHPDLQIRNTTPYGVLVWADYDGTSITVSMYSTKVFGSVTQSNQSRSAFGPGCTRVRTERTRTYLDGRSVVDTVSATYQPGEGVKCR